MEFHDFDTLNIIEYIDSPWLEARLKYYDDEKDNPDHLPELKFLLEEIDECLDLYKTEGFPKCYMLQKSKEIVKESKSKTPEIVLDVLGDGSISFKPKFSQGRINQAKEEVEEYKRFKKARNQVFDFLKKHPEE